MCLSANYESSLRRGSKFLTACLRVPGVPPDSNLVERSNRKVVSARAGLEGLRKRIIIA